MNARAGYLTSAELRRLVTDEEYASQVHTYFGLDTEVIVSIWATEVGLQFEAKRNGRAKPVDSGEFDNHAVAMWFGDIGDESWARA